MKLLRDDWEMGEEFLVLSIDSTKQDIIQNYVEVVELESDYASVEAIDVDRSSPHLPLPMSKQSKMLDLENPEKVFAISRQINYRIGADRVVTAEGVTSDLVD